MRFTRDCSQDGNALGRDAETAVAEDVGRIDLHEADSRPRAGTARSIESVQLSGSVRLVHVNERAESLLTDRRPSIYLRVSIRKVRDERALFKRTRELAVSFRERYGRVCNAGCRRAALRERALLRPLPLGLRV
jgi:hypothetical protein